MHGHARVHKENSGRWRPCTWHCYLPSGTWHRHLLPLQPPHRPPVQVQLHLPPHPHLPPALRAGCHFTRPKIRYSVGGGNSGGLDRRGRHYTLGITAGGEDGWEESWRGRVGWFKGIGVLQLYARRFSRRWRGLRPEPSTVDVGESQKRLSSSSSSSISSSSSQQQRGFPRHQQQALLGKASGDLLRQYPQPTRVSRIVVIPPRIAGFCHRLETTHCHVDNVDDTVYKLVV